MAFPSDLAASKNTSSTAPLDEQYTHIDFFTNTPFSSFFWKKERSKENHLGFAGKGSDAVFRNRL